MKDKKPLDLERIKAIDERIKKDYPNKKAVPLGNILEKMGKKKYVSKKKK